VSCWTFAWLRSGTAGRRGGCRPWDSGAGQVALSVLGEEVAWRGIATGLQMVAGADLTKLA
jgi:hypothetical protein